VAFNSNSFAIWWNGVKIENIVPSDYKIHTFLAEVEAVKGENTLAL